jgi:hypothetical protein
LAVHHYHFNTQKVIGGQTIFKAVNAASILRDIAADRTGNLA